MTCSHSHKHMVPSLKIDCAYCQDPSAIGLAYALAKHTGFNMIFPHWELDQDRRCLRGYEIPA